MNRTYVKIAMALTVAGCTGASADRESVGSSSQELFSTENLPATIYDSNSSEERFFAGDTNADGRADVIQTYRGWSSIPVCRASFGGWACANPPATIYNSGSPDQRFLTGDFNRDRALDVFQVYRGWASIPVCLAGTGATPSWTCTNAPATIYDAGSPEQQFLADDFNGDRRSDVIQTYRGWSSIPVCLAGNDATPTWRCSNPPATIYNSGSAEQRFLTGDFNGDGSADVFQTWRGWSSIPVAVRNASGWTSSNPAATIYNSGSPEQQFLVGDFNGDGKADVVQTWRGWSSIPLCLSTGTGWSCSNPPATIYDSGSADQRFIAADVNGDGRTDIVQTYRGWSSYPVCFSTGSGWSCSNLPATIFDSGSGEQQFLAGDFNGDGTKDMFQTYRGWASIPTSLSW